MDTKYKLRLLGSELAKDISNPCLDCPFLLATREDILNYCLEECKDKQMHNQTTKEEEN